MKRPLSPGAIALLVEHAKDVEVQRRPGQALTHESPDVRAAAARVIFISVAKGLLPDLRAALQRERLEDPALEQMRALSSLLENVIAPTGCVRESRVLTSADARLDLHQVTVPALSRGVGNAARTP